MTQGGSAHIAIIHPAIAIIMTFSASDATPSGTFRRAVDAGTFQFPPVDTDDLQD